MADPLDPRRRRRLPARAHRHQRRAGPHGRHLGRVDPRAHRHPPAPPRRAARDRRLHGHAAAARAALAACRRQRGRGRRDHPRHQHARPGVSRPPRCACRRPSASPGLRLRPRRRLHRLHLRAVGRRRHDPRRPGARRAGDRQRGLFAHPELAGPRHLRAVRRRRRGGVPARRRGQRQRSIAASCPPTCMPTARSATSCMSTARSASRTSPGIW